MTIEFLAALWIWLGMGTSAPATPLALTPAAAQVAPGTGPTQGVASLEECPSGVQTCGEMRGGIDPDG